jgi:hypothetical protein
VVISRWVVPLLTVAALVMAAEAQAQGAFPAPLPGASAPSQSPFPPVNGAPAAKPSPFPPVNQTSAPSQSPFPPVNQAPAVNQAAAPAQSPFPPVGGGSAFGQGAAPLPGGFTPVPGSAPGPQQQSRDGEQCMKEFLPLRQETERRGERIRKASERKAPPAEACKLIGDYMQAEVKMMKYVEANAQRCGIPPDLSKQIRDSHKNTQQLRSRVCNAAAQMQQPRGPAGPSLSEVLGSTALPQANAERPRGGSTFDTLTGNVLQR